MSVTDFLNTTVYPSLYDQLPAALPEFGFVLKGGHYENTAKIKVTGELANDAGKVHVYRNNPGRLIGYKATDIKASIWDYIQGRDRLSNGETFTRLCALAGVTPPEIERSPEQVAAIVAHRRKVEALEVLNAFFIEALHTGTAPQFAEARDYLKQRGCNPATLRKPGSTLLRDSIFTPIEAGFIPGRDMAKKALEDGGFTPDEIAPLFDGGGNEAPAFFPAQFGKTHRLLFAIRDAAGDIVGFVARALDSTTQPKYLLTRHSMGQCLLNFHARHFDRHTKTAVIVEGVLDALFAGAAGLHNVFGIIGAKFGPGHVELLKRAKVTDVVLFMDADAGGNTGTIQGIDVFQNAGFTVFVAIMPEGGGKDLADLLQQPDGVQKAKQVIDEARHRDAWRFIFDQYLIEFNSTEATPADARTFAGNVAALAAKLPPFQRDQLAAAFEQWGQESGSGLTRAALHEEAEKIRFNVDNERRAREIKKTLAAANVALSSGDTGGSLEALRKGVTETEKATVIDLLPPRLTSAEILHSLQNRPPGILTGWENLDEFFRIPRGLVTLLGGRPSCGKTAALLNLFYNLAQNDAAGPLYYFAFEDNRENYFIKLLSIILNADFNEDLQQADRYRNRRIITTGQFLEAYLTDTAGPKIPQIEAAKDLLFDLLNSGRIQIYREPYTVEQLAAICGRLADQDADSIVLVDYIQRVRAAKDFRETVARLEYVSNGLNEAAQKSGLAIIAGAQIGRAEAGKDSKSLEGLKGSGSLEEDAGAVLNIYNPYKESKEDAREEFCKDGRTVVGWKISAAKNRYGKPDEIALFNFDQYTQRITPAANTITFS